MAHGYAKDKADVQARLKRIEGQVRGVQRMVDEDRYCIDILNKVALVLLKDHVDHCVADALRAGEGEEKLDELTAAIGRFLSG
jgi:DNA-binding FrmR family transcriptional regulator